MRWTLLAVLGGALSLTGVMVSRAESLQDACPSIPGVWLEGCPVLLNASTTSLPEEPEDCECDWDDLLRKGDKVRALLEAPDPIHAHALSRWKDVLDEE